MRPQQQNRRMRGRNNNGNNNSNNSRKGPNPLTRSYESNGPDVKIRGSAQQIAEKYTTLARDATSSGDRVMAENYLQHAEHYNRIIAAAQAQMPIQHQQAPREADDDDMDDERDEFDMPVVPGNYGQGQGQGRQRADNSTNQNGGRNNDSYAGQNGFGGGNGAPASQPVNHAEAPQPVIEGMPAEVAFNAEAGGEGNRSERNENRREGRFRDGRERRRDRRFDNLNGVLSGGQANRPDNEAATPAQAGAAPAHEAPSGEMPVQVEPAPGESVAPPAEMAPAVSEPTQPAAEGEQASLFAGGPGDSEGATRRGRRPRRTRRTEGEDGQAAGGDAPAPDFGANLAPVAE